MICFSLLTIHGLGTLTIISYFSAASNLILIDRFSFGKLFGLFEIVV